MATGGSAWAGDRMADFAASTLEFVADVSAGDKKMASKVRSAVANPDPRPEACGFYLSDDVADEEVVFRTAIYALKEAGYILGFEDKYVNEMLYVLLRNQVLPRRGLSRPTKKFIDQLSGLFDESERHEQAMAERFAAAVREIEGVAASQGTYLLSLNLGGGDTHHIIPVDEEIYRKWRDVDFGHDLAVTGVAWPLIWESIAYYVFDTEGSLAYEAPILRRLAKRQGE